ncbi:hypothetical protein D9757_011544 [Collybiopsis confluens]|uniref:Uncharacterized protein n=1 Tax=Collybiopsis confluens TaxID=2823264 RepID=A0A8H5GAZ5_9AGAR|nr:hypothetical protein D9757_011544 [Collybiopsis confluens]
MLALRVALLLGSAIGCAFSSIIPSGRRATEGTIQTIHTFSNGTIMENLAIRSNGQILATVVTRPDLYLLEPKVNSPATLLHTFTGFQTVFGIVELENDQFYVVTGNASVLALTSVQGSWVAWKVDMHAYSRGSKNFVSMVARLPGPKLVNGVGILNKEAGLLYLADPFGGAISVLNVYNGHQYVAINNSLTIPGPPYNTTLGVNGVHVYQANSRATPYVYWSNTAQSKLVRMPIHLSDGTPAGRPEVILSGYELDDFTFDSQGNILQAVIGSSSIFKINPNTKKYTVVGGSMDSTELAGPSAIQLGRLSSDKNVAYVTLNGLGKVPGAVKMLNLGPTELVHRPQRRRVTPTTMARPTMIQTLLGRPSQSYSFPQEKQYFSTKPEMLRVAWEAHAMGNNEVQVQARERNLMETETESHVIDSHPVLNPGDQDNSDDDLFYTPNTSPRSSMASSLNKHLRSPAPSEASIATRTPLTSRSTVASMSTNSLDAHSIFSLDSNAVSDSTFVTTPNSSETGHESFSKTSRRSSGRGDQMKPPSVTYTDEDWAKDVRWLAPPASSKSKKKPKSSVTTSYYIAQLPPKIIPQPPSPPPSNPIPRPRPKHRSKSPRKNNPTIMMNMAALLEVDEDRESVHRSSQGSLRSSTATPERTRTSSNPTPGPGVRQRTSNSLRRQNNPAKSPLGRRKSRSLEDIQYVARAQLPEPASVPGDLTLISSSTYTPSIPSSGTRGFTSLVLPRAPQPAFVPNPSKRVSVVGGADGKIDLTKSGIAQTTMATVEVTRGLVCNSKGGVFGLFNRARSRSGKEGSSGSSRKAAAGSDAVLSFTSYRRPPDYIPAGSVLVQVWAVAVDGVDARLAGVVHSRARSSNFNSSASQDASHIQQQPVSSGKPGLFRSVSVRSKHRGDDPSSGKGSGVMGIEPDVGHIPGRSFVGRVLECGWDVKEEVVRKGEWVVGLLDVKKCGALQEFILADRRRVFRIPHPNIPSVSILSDSSSSPVTTPSSPSATPSPGTSSKSKPLSRPTRPPNLNFNPPLTIDEYALLPLCGVFAYRAVRTLAYAFGKPSTNSADPFPSSSSGGSNGRHINEHGEEGRRRRVLVLRGHDGVGGMAVQMLVRRGWRVCVHASLPDGYLEEGSKEESVYMESVERRVRRWGAEEVVFDDGYGRSVDGPGCGFGGEGSEDEGVAAVVRVIERLIGDGDVFDAVLDAVGGKEVWEASERLLRNTGVSAPDPVRLDTGSSLNLASLPHGMLKGSLSIRKKKREKEKGKEMEAGNSSHGTGQFTTLVGDTPGRPIPTPGDLFKAGLRSLKSTHKTGQDGVGDEMVKKGGLGRVGYAWVSLAQDVDWEGGDVRDSVAAVVNMAMNEGVRPWVGVGEDGRVVPFERTPAAFVANGPLGNGGTVVVKLVE